MIDLYLLFAVRGGLIKIKNKGEVFLVSFLMLNEKWFWSTRSFIHLNLQNREMDEELS